MNGVDNVVVLTVRRCLVRMCCWNVKAGVQVKSGGVDVDAESSGKRATRIDNGVVDVSV